MYPVNRPASRIIIEEMRMRSHRIAFLFLGAGFLLLVTVGTLFLLPPRSVSAQCGSQASSCKNCHETQAKDPVNSDGTAWHTQHAFGDFCYLCHAGNNQATDETAAHTGMVAPLSDIDASCKSCHPNDTSALAQTYAATLGQTVGAGSAVSATQPAVAAATPSQAAPVATQAPVVLSADMVDYSQRYDTVALGQKPVNTGNIILLVMLGILVLGGGSFVLQREGVIKVFFEDPKRIAVSGKYPADVVEMLPGISKLNGDSRKALHNILAKPKVAADLFTSIDRLSQAESLEESTSAVELDSDEDTPSDLEE
jgi:hypothetical protein